MPGLAVSLLKHPITEEKAVLAANIRAAHVIMPQPGDTARAGAVELETARAPSANRRGGHCAPCRAHEQPWAARAAASPP